MITDRRHADKLEAITIQAVRDLFACWRREHEDANAPSTGSTVPITGGETSDPVANTALDDTRERHLNWMGSRITGHLDAIQQDIAKWTPRTVADVGMCGNCSAMPGVEDGYCPKCGRFLRTHGFLPDPKTVKEGWEAQTDKRECRRWCGTMLPTSSSQRVCDECQARQAARRQKDYRDRQAS